MSMFPQAEDAARKQLDLDVSHNLRVRAMHGNKALLEVSITYSPPRNPVPVECRDSSADARVLSYSRVFPTNFFNIAHFVSKQFLFSFLR